MDFTKIFGWILLIGGVTIICWTLCSSYNIFTGKSQAPDIFKIEESLDKINEKGTNVPLDLNNIQAELQKMISQQMQGMVPQNAIPILLNLIIWAILTGILIFGGTQIATLGIKLVKKQ